MGKLHPQTLKLLPVGLSHLVQVFDKKVAQGGLSSAFVNIQQKSFIIPNEFFDILFGSQRLMREPAGLLALAGAYTEHFDAGVE